MFLKYVLRLLFHFVDETEYDRGNRGQCRTYRKEK